MSQRFVIPGRGWSSTTQERSFAVLAMLSLVVIESEPWCQNYLEYGMAEDEMPLPGACIRPMMDLCANNQHIRTERRQRARQ